jgi:hypothetical protein
MECLCRRLTLIELILGPAATTEAVRTMSFGLIHIKHTKSPPWMLYKARKSDFNAYQRQG